MAPRAWVLLLGWVGACSGQTMPNGALANCSAASSPLDDSNILARVGHAFSCGLEAKLPGYVTTAVTSMEGLFDGRTVGVSLSGWQTSSVTSMTEIFNGATITGSLGLSGWDVSKVENFAGAFFGADLSFDSLSGWDTGAATSMNNMFEQSTLFNGNIGAWDVRLVQSFNNMFNGATAFNRDLNAWVPESVVDLSSMFEGASAFNGDVSGWDTGSATSLVFAFKNALAFNQDLNAWAVQSVTDARWAFYGATVFNGNVYDWDTSAMRTMDGMFEDAAGFNRDVSQWDVSGVTSMDEVFAGALAFNQPLPWNIASLTSTRSLLENAASFNSAFPAPWSTAGVTSMVSMFKGATAFNQPINDWDVRQVADATTLFMDATAFDQDLNGWNLTALVEYTDMFAGALSFFQLLDRWATLDATGPDSMFGYGTPVVTTLACGAGTYRSVLQSSGLVLGQSCEPCPAGTFRPAAAAGDVTECIAHRACPAAQVPILSGHAEMDTVCGVVDGGHCDASSFAVGFVNETATGQWVFHCAAHNTSCPAAFPDDHVLEVSNATAAAMHQAIDANLHEATANGLDIVHHPEAVYVPVCTPKQQCLYANNQYVISPGSGTADRTCGYCPRLCAGSVSPQPDVCGQGGNWSEAPWAYSDDVPFNECTRPDGDNSPTCCRGSYDRTVVLYVPTAYQSVCHAAHHTAEFQPGAECSGTNTAADDAAGLTAITSTSTFTSTTGTQTESVVTVTSTTTSTTTQVPCGRGKYYDTLAGECADCPEGQFQPSESSYVTECQPRTPCTHDEIELIDFNATHRRMADSVCGSIHGCSHGQYRAGIGSNGDFDVADPAHPLHQVGKWKVSCTDMQQLLDEWEASDNDIPFGEDRLDCDAMYELTISHHGGTWTVDTPLGHLVGHEKMRAVAALQKVRVCLPWRTCVAANNEYVSVEGTELNDRECLPCPVIRAGCWDPAAASPLFPHGRALNQSSQVRAALFGPDGDTAHPCNTQPTAAGGAWTDYVPPGGAPECTRVSHDNQPFCCRVGYDRAVAFFDNTGDTEWNSSAPQCTVAQTCTRPGWRYELVTYPTTSTSTVTESTRTTTTVTTVYGGWIHDTPVASRASSRAARIVGWSTLGVAGLAVVWALVRQRQTDGGGEYAPVEQDTSFNSAASDDGPPSYTATMMPGLL